MALFLMSVSIGNLFTAGVNFFIQNEDGSSKLEGPEYYLFFAGAMAVTAVLFIPVAMRYREKTYIQEEGEADSPVGEPIPLTYAPRQIGISSASARISWSAVGTSPNWPGGSAPSSRMSAVFIPIAWAPATS